MGYLDEDGYLYLVDRRVDMIITGGANVFPAEVETALIDHPEDRRRRRDRTARPGVGPPGARDHRARRSVAIRRRDDEVIAYAESRLAHYKVPKTIEIVDAIPRSEATKVNRGRLVEARGG